MILQIPPGFAVWMTGLPSSGKTTLAQTLAQILSEHGINVQILDSDDLREILTPQPSYSRQERDWFYRVLGYIAGLLTRNGVNVIIAATGSLRRYRQEAREGLDPFLVVYVVCPVEVCKQRDPKGLWKSVERGEITGLPGADAPYEEPISPHVRIDTQTLSPRAAAQQVFEILKSGKLI